MKILLVGGGSGGPVAPLLAVAEHIKNTHPKAEFLFIGGRVGPEAAMAKRAGIRFVPITAGKWRRYFHFGNILTPLQVVIGFFQSWKILAKFRPDCVAGAGSFVQVPVIWAAWARRVPVALHQQDVLPGLANRLCEHAADKITVTFSDSLTDFSSGLGLFYKKNKNKIVLTGNPSRESLKRSTRAQGLKRYGLKPDLPTVLVLGGGTGAAALNKLVADALPQLARVVQIIHSTGSGKSAGLRRENYQAYEFIQDMAQAYAAADIVIARAGLSTITELSNLGKVSIIIPMPESHQELNGFLLYRQQAAIVLDQRGVSAEGLVQVVRRLLFEPALQERLKDNIGKIMPHDSNAKISDIIVKLAEQHST